MQLPLLKTWAWRCLVTQLRSWGSLHSTLLPPRGEVSGGPVCRQRAPGFRGGPRFVAPQRLPLKTGCECPQRKTVLVRSGGVWVGGGCCSARQSFRRALLGVRLQPSGAGLRRQNQGSERVSEWPKVTQRVRDRGAGRQSSRRAVTCRQEYLGGPGSLSGSVTRSAHGRANAGGGWVVDMVPAQGRPPESQRKVWSSSSGSSDWGQGGSGLQRRAHP